MTQDRIRMSTESDLSVYAAPGLSDATDASEHALSAARRHGVLCDMSIRGAVGIGLLGIDPYQPQHVQAASYDLMVDLERPLTLWPGSFHLLSTIERVSLPDCLQGQLHGRSSLARKGILIHFTGGFIDPGFEGNITLEVMALVTLPGGPVRLNHGDRVAQISFSWLDHPCASPYHGRYQGQSGPTESRFAHGEG
jgi:deoxycytidine triphosphate deaminase